MAGGQLHYWRIGAGLAGLCLLGAAPADPLLARLLAGASGSAANLDFERTSVQAQTSGGKTERRTVVERWDGRAWTVLGIDGRPPTAKAAAQIVKASSAAPVPGYYRLGLLLGSGAVRGQGPRGEVVYRLAELPPGGVAMKGAPPEKFSAEFLVDDSGTVPIVRHARYYAPAPMRVMMVAKLDRFEATSDFRFGARGRPELVRQNVDLAGTLFGRSGTQHNEISYVHR